MDFLIPYQQEHTNNLINIIKKNGRALDASMMGLGKTYCAVVSCLMLGLRPFIICPKIVFNTWISVMENFNCDYYGITSYELIQRMKYFDNENNKIECEFIKCNENNKYKDDDNGYVINENLIPDDVIIIYDEVHKCKNIKTLNGQILYAFTNTRLKILMLSGTVADQPVYFVLVGLVLKLYNNYDDGHKWIINKSKILDANNYMLAFHKIIYPNYASKINENIMKELYPNCHIEAKCFSMDTKNEIDKNYEEMLEKIKINKHSYLAEYSKANQKNELLKLPTVVKKTLKAVENGNSVVIFVNYTNTINELSKQLNTKCIVNGEINEIEKNINIKNFNDDIERIIICNLKAGSNSISLHDLHGNHPRISFIMPTWSITDLVQSLGRIYRANVKTPTFQYIVLSNSINELYIQNKIKDKLNNISLLNSGNNKEPLFKINNLIVKNEDVETKFGVALKINRDDKKKIKKEINNLKIKETNRIEKKKMVFINNDYFSIIKMLETLKKKKYNTLKMNESEEKKTILEQIDFEMNECDIMLQETLNNFT